jgi:hypothetical protein
VVYAGVRREASFEALRKLGNWRIRPILLDVTKQVGAASFSSPPLPRSPHTLDVYLSCQDQIDAAAKAIKEQLESEGRPLVGVSPKATGEPTPLLAYVACCILHPTLRKGPTVSSHTLTALPVLPSL